ncbi:MAG: hypothetical protein E3J87_02565 [Candidatus Cloacimonadota bacterium]|nr:MAG: hypothetical protein E3J87_02565 [Candidatus Cloacimonadota bacterium]
MVKFYKFSFVFSILALSISILTFVKTGGISDIKEQINVIKQDIKEVRAQTELRMENRSFLFDALCDLTASVDSLKTGETIESKKLVDAAIEKMMNVEKKLLEKKRKHLEKIRIEIERLKTRLKPNDSKIVGDLEYQIMLLRIFEENL